MKITYFEPAHPGCFALEQMGQKRFLPGHDGVVGIRAAGAAAVVVVFEGGRTLTFTAMGVVEEVPGGDITATATALATASATVVIEPPAPPAKTPEGVTILTPEQRAVSDEMTAQARAEDHPAHVDPKMWVPPPTSGAPKGARRR